MKVQTLTIEKKRFALIPEKEYLSLVNDVADIKKVLRRRQETGIEANLFFEKLKAKRKTK
jgi:hypothetical protein